VFGGKGKTLEREGGGGGRVEGLREKRRGLESTGAFS
jgi:hypothetical protein